MKSTATTDPKLNKLIAAWKGLRDSVPFFGPIRNERDYTRMQALMDQLLDLVGDDEDHPLADLLDVVGVLVDQYEEEHTPSLSTARPTEVLKFLKINARQAKSLARRFGVSPVVFL